MREKAKGIGEYDWRYIRTIADIMGEEGIVSKLGPNGLLTLSNPNILGGCSLERQWPQISHGSVMGNFDPLRGMRIYCSIKDHSGREPYFQ